MSTPAQPGYYPPRRQPSFFLPMVLIAIGIIALLKNFGMIAFTRYQLLVWFARYWPLLLILLGVVKLGEYAWARQTGNPPPRFGAGSIVFVVFFVLFGLTATGVSRVDWRGVGHEIGADNDTDVDDFFNGMFGNRYDFSDSFSQPVNTATQVKILGNYGDIKITQSTDDQIHAIVQKALRSGSQSDADKINEATHPKFEQQGTIAVLDLTSGNYQKGHFDLDLQLPRTMALSVNTHHGDITISGRDANVDITTDHGDVNLDQIKGDAAFHLRRDKGSVTAKDVGGNVTIDGNIGDTNLSDVRGTVTMTGTYWGDMHLARIGKQVHFSTSRTDLQFNRLDGEFSMQPDELSANGITGPFRLDTKSKSVTLQETTGDIHINNRNAPIELRPKALGAIDVTNAHGEIKVELPASAAFQLDAESTNGNIETDFDLRVDNGPHNATASGAVGKGGPTIRLRTDRDNIEVRKQ